MVWPGTNQVAGTSNFASSCSSRSVPTMPKSPREIMVGVAEPREMATEVLSRSKVRQTKCWGMSFSMAPHSAQGYPDQADQSDERPRSLDDRRRQIELLGQ